MAGSASSRNWRVLVGLVTGATLGSITNALTTGQPQLESIRDAVVQNVTQPVGRVFLNLLFMGIIPLVFASVALGVARLGNIGQLGRIGIKTLIYFLITTAFAAAIGLTLVNLVKPGDYLPEEQQKKLDEKFGSEAKDRVQKKSDLTIPGLVNSIIPANPLKSATDKEMLAIIFTAIIVGIALTRIETQHSQTLIHFLEGVNAVTDFILRLAMSLAPYAVFCLLFSVTAQLGFQFLFSLLAFMLTVLGGLAIQLVVVFPILVWFLGGMSPWTFFARSYETMLTAFSTSSSNATLPTVIRCAEENLGISPTVSRFVLPIGASMNHNGTALFEGVTVMFLAQISGVDLTFVDQLQILLLCVLTATGMAGIPGGSLPLIGVILAQYNIPPERIALVLGIDRILDMSRTMVNVTGDLTTVLYVNRTEAKRQAQSSLPQPTAEK
jgi:DAACS family dicarboxylate/amino acid:cation (Na+ or H+) symporter